MGKWLRGEFLGVLKTMGWFFRSLATFGMTMNWGYSCQGDVSCVGYTCAYFADCLSVL